MKKLLTILLALLVVTGVVFADPTYPANNDNATLTLTSSVDGFFEHGFLVDSETELGDYSADVKLHGADNERLGQVLGTYNIDTNSSKGFTVKFTLNPMHHLKAGETEGSFVDSTLAYVPYLLKVVEGGSNGNRYSVLETATTTGIGSLSKWGNSSAALFDNTVVTVANTGGSQQLELTLKADFYDNSDLPEGNYEGTIVATLIVQ
jgi:hypothetical protein